MLFEGIPVYLEWSTEDHLFQIVTLKLQPRWQYQNYNVNWCDNRGCYYIEKDGTPTLPYILTNKADPSAKVAPYFFWAAPHFPLLFDSKAYRSYCQRVTVEEAVSLLFPGMEERDEFFREYPGFFMHQEMIYTGPWLQTLLGTWAMAGYAKEGRVIECPICRCAYDYDSLHPCPHLSWCEECNCWSVPPFYEGGEDCRHRSPDGLYYCPPQ